MEPDRRGFRPHTSLARRGCQVTEPAVRNIFPGDGEYSVAALQARGVLFLVCGTALRIASAAWAPSVSQTAEATLAELKANLLPGVVEVPALVVALNRAQEAGFTYVRAS